jgi:hypothetical protein
VVCPNRQNDAAPSWIIGEPGNDLASSRIASAPRSMRASRVVNQSIEATSASDWAVIGKPRASRVIRPFS